jgi:UDPglucose 6-dehydrogenase
MKKKIAVIGTGYVGLVTSLGLSDFGHTVVGIDIDETKVSKLNQGIPPIFEHNIQEYLSRNLEAQRLSFTTEINSALENVELIFIALGTPSDHGGGADLSQIEGVLDVIAESVDDFKTIVTKSTVPPGSNRWIYNEIKKRSGKDNFAVVSNPEFLREGKAIQDFFHPDRLVIGYEDERAREMMEDTYRALNLINTPFVWCGLETAEMIKYASNAFLATKITFINQMANLAETVGADIHLIARSMGMDGRISPKFLHPGPGYGGSCFPKDTRAIVKMGENNNVDMSLIKEVIAANEWQKGMVVEKMKKVMGNLKGKTIAVLGLAFKAETDDIRESAAITIVEKLLDEEAVLRLHDPQALENFAKDFPVGPQYFEHVTDALFGADAAVICTEWNEYRNIDMDKAMERMNDCFLFDTRNLLDPAEARQKGFKYVSTGRP